MTKYSAAPHVHTYHEEKREKKWDTTLGHIPPRSAFSPPSYIKTKKEKISMAPAIAEGLRKSNNMCTFVAFSDPLCTGTESCLSNSIQGTSQCGVSGRNALCF